VKKRLMLISVSGCQLVAARIHRENAVAPGRSPGSPHRDLVHLCVARQASAGDAVTPDGAVRELLQPPPRLRDDQLAIVPE
jgi:hypothetical protein